MIESKGYEFQTVILSKCHKLLFNACALYLSVSCAETSFKSQRLQEISETITDFLIETLQAMLTYLDKPLSTPVSSIEHSNIISYFHTQSHKLDLSLNNDYEKYKSIIVQCFIPSIMHGFGLYFDQSILNVKIKGSFLRLLELLQSQMLQSYYNRFPMENFDVSESEDGSTPTTTPRDSETESIRTY